MDKNIKGIVDPSFILEIGLKKRNGEISDTWNHLANIHGNGFFVDGEAYRIWVKNRLKSKNKQTKNEKVSFNDDEYEDKIMEMKKQKYQFQDQKRELNAKIRMLSKYDHLKEEIIRSIEKLEKVKPLNFSKPIKANGNVRANLLLSDFHYGQESDNTFNTYNPEIFEKRFEFLISRVLYYCDKHNVKELTIGAIGDFVNGMIHVSTRVESSEDVISQIQHVSERLSEAVSEIASVVPKVRVINVIGNHARMSPNKNESLLRENLENIIPWYMETRLRECKNVEILKSKDGIFVDSTFKIPQVMTHGDLDHVSNTARSLPQVLGIVPSYIFMGHIHHDTVKDYGRTVVISNGSLCGVDEYAISKRMYADAMQKMHIFNNDEKVEYTININLQNIGV